MHQVSPYQARYLAKALKEDCANEIGSKVLGGSGPSEGSPVNKEMASHGRCRDRTFESIDRGSAKKRRQGLWHKHLKVLAEVQ